jgi:hypothetical protein
MICTNFTLSVYVYILTLGVEYFLESGDEPLICLLRARLYFRYLLKGSLLL